jgi:tetratricopeptide (TPR) repeat protein
VAKVVSVQGTVEVKKVGEALWQPVKLNDTYCPGDEIQTGESSRANLALINEAVLRLNQNTSMALGEFKGKQTSLVDLFKGAAHFFSRSPRSLEVNTPSAKVGVRGTEFFIEVKEGQTFVSIFQGEVLAENKFGQVTLTSGQSAVVERGKAPAMRVVVRPRDAVQWALYYPPVIYFPEEVREDRGDPRFLAYSASQLLAVGRVDEADAEIGRALSLDPNYSDAFALQGIIAVVQNERDKAFSAAQQAVEADPNSAAAQIALSYAQQASFDLEGARASLENAVQLDPENALAWARLAELQASFGYLTQSVESAEKAVALDPNVSRTQTVLGFAYLTQVRIGESKEAFEKAIKLDQADPLPRLGLGLAKIRRGDLEDGRAEIEIAASLDPNNSLIRSYLGKAYFEEKRTELDGPEYKIAKELNPKDPTPFFYDAIRKQTINRPVEALRDFQKAIELNDNRAVFRSKLKLDSDEAARSSSLARIYSNLGFQELALVEGWKAVNTDPTNHSAHRFLADSYAARPRHEIARVSELLQSQLLQPQNITPIQPRLAESNLFLISGQGPASLSFNEFNPIFSRNGATAQFSTLAGENDTIAGEFVLSAIQNRLSWSVGYSLFDTDGWRENADQDDKIANAFLQYELSYKTSIQAEYRYRDEEIGDLQQIFFEDDFFPGLTDKSTNRSIRLGGRHALSPGSILLGNFMYQNRESTLTDIDPPFPGLSFFEVDGEFDSYSSELQHLLRSQYVDLTTGAGYFDIDGDDVTVTAVTFFGTQVTPLEADIQHLNLYGYSYIKPLSNLTFTIGASYDNLDADEGLIAKGDREKFNPKFGIIWNPFPSTTVRGAAFRVFKRTLITDQTLEPTQVAGFNQFFDDLNATDSWRYGAAIDQKFTEDIYGGLEFSYRDLNVPVFDLSTGDAINSNDDEYEGRAYLFWTPHEWLALRGEYQYERLETGVAFEGEPKNLDTHRVPVGANFFHPSGLSATLTGTYLYQEGKFLRLATGIEESGDDTFFLVDAGISYRFPKRYGFFSLGVTNLFDEDFNYYEVDAANPSIQPDRFFFASITLAVP